MDYNIPEKANRVLNLIILGFILILVRVWYLSIVQHEDHLEKARKPMRRTAIEKVERATIRDRFNIPMAINKIQYNAAVCYADIRSIPAGKWEIDAKGKRTRVPVRSQYIKKLSELLSKELQIEAQAIEDTIHGKASLFPHTPFILKEDLTEEAYCRLKMLEKDWVGIRTEQGSKRHYPLGKVGCDVIGYMGAISSNEYYKIAQELKILQAYLAMREAGEIAVLPKGFNNPLEVRERMKVLQEKAYTINDLVGKAGLESSFDAELRGYAGKKTYEVDTKGNLLRELPGERRKVPGQRLILSISSELQEFAEQLLMENERVREVRHPNGEPDLSAPWIKGGAIVALDPKTGEVLALASYPRTDPNDFVLKRSSAIIKWLENEAYIGEIWDGKRPLERERVGSTETLELTYEKYLESILPPHSSILAAMQNIGTVGSALALQQEMESLLELSGQSSMQILVHALYPDHPSRKKVNVEETLQPHSRKFIDSILGKISYNDDKLLVLDLCRLFVPHVEPELVESVSSLSLSGYRVLNQAATIIKSQLQTQARIAFHQNEFQQWRNAHFKEYLRSKRREEKAKKHYAKPYTDYLEQIEKEMFKSYWAENHLKLMHEYIWQHAEDKHAQKLQHSLAALPPDLQLKFLAMMRSFEDLNQPLYGHYRSLRHVKGVQLEKHLAAAFYPLQGHGYGRSQAFRQSTPQGSVFKLVAAYQGLLERYQELVEMHKSLNDINPLTIIEDLKWHPKSNSSEQILGYSMDGQPIKRIHKGGKLPKSHPGMGKCDVATAIEQSSNIYFSILAAEQLNDPFDLVDAAKNFGYGERTGIELPGEIVGNLPDDINHNLTGLYSFAFGQHSLVVTPLQTAVMMAAIGNKGHVLKPKIIQVIAGQEPLREYRDPFDQTQFPFQEQLSAIGVHFPLFTATQSEAEDPFVWYSSPEVKRRLFMPDPIRDPMIEGMHRVIVSPKGSARPGVIQALARNPQWMRNYHELKSQLIGKTGTAEVFYKPTIDAESEAVIQNHIWFGGIAFAPEEHQTWENPELVVIVYLRFSKSGGKEAAPLGTEIIKKWREICKRHGKNAYITPRT